MSIARTFWEDHDELVRRFHVAIIYGMLSAWERCTEHKTKPQEPDLVAGIVVDGAPLIYSALNSVLSLHQKSVSIFAVFCHQTPQVAFGSHPSVSCELGDVLFAYVHTPKTGTPTRNAILFQAKASARQPYRIPNGCMNQLRLYTAWPKFVYKRSGVLSNKKRIVTPNAPHAGAQYLLIDDRPPQEPMSGLMGIPGTYPVGCCMPDEFLHDHTHLAAELFSLLTFRTGRPFEDKKSAEAKQDWSAVVWDMLVSGLRNSFFRKNFGKRRIPRVTTHIMDGVSFSRATSSLACRTATNVLGEQPARLLYGIDPDISPGNIHADEKQRMGGSGIGVSVVLIETSEEQIEGQSERTRGI